MLIPHYFPFLMQSVMAVAWVHQDFFRPINLS